MRRSGSLLAALLSLLRLRPLAPDIGKGLPPDYAEGTKAFDARVKARFPPGTSEEALRAELKRQGFERLPDHPDPDGLRCATFCRNELIFKTLWSVRWRANGGRVGEIFGVYGCVAP